MNHSPSSVKVVNHLPSLGKTLAQQLKSVSFTVFCVSSILDPYASTKLKFYIALSVNLLRAVNILFIAFMKAVNDSSHL